MTYNCLEHLEDIASLLGTFNKTAAIDSNRSITYRQLYTESKEFGLALLSNGVNYQDRIILSKDDSIQFIIEFLGCLYVGIVPVLINNTLSDSEIQDIKTKSKAVDIKGQHVNTVVTPSQADDDAFILCTSGTTGKTKLVVHSQKSICGTGLQFGPLLNIASDDVIFSAAKMTHAYGLGNSLSIPFTHGATVILEPSLPTPDKIADHIQNNNVTIFCGVPRHYTSLLNVNRLYNFSSLKVCLSAGESLPKIVNTDFTNRYNCSIIDAIGSSELLGFALSDGLPVDGCLVKLVDDYEEEVSPGNIGELYVKSEYAATRYFEDAPATKYSFRDGWIKTGDMYQVNKEGVFIYKGRKNDCIKVNGSYVSLTNLEKDLYAIESILETAVVSCENKYGLNKIEIFVVLKEGYDLNIEYVKILDQFKLHNTMFKRPYTIKIVDELPRTASGKIKKYILLTR